MPQYRATKNFGTDKSKYGLIRTGQVVTMPAHDAEKFNRANPGVLVEHGGPSIPDEESHFPHAHEEHAENAPRNHADDAAPRTAAEDAEGDDMGNEPDDSADDDTPASRKGGRGRRSSVSRPGRRSRKKTST